MLSAPLPSAPAADQTVVRPGLAVGWAGAATRARAALLRPSLWPALALLSIYAVFYVQFAVQLVVFPFDVDQGEGYDAWSAWLIDRGQLPYTANEQFPYYSSNYPPLWSYLVSVPMAWTGPGLAPARAVSVAAALLAAGVVGLAARRAARSPLAGVLATGLFLGSPYVFHTTPLARVNGTALLLAALALWSFESPSRRRVVLGSLALLGALFTKPTAVDAAVACIGFALVLGWRRGLLAGALVGGLGGAGLGALVLASKGAFWLNVVTGNANPFDAAQLRAYLLNFGTIHAVVLGLALFETGRAIRRRAVSPWHVYLLTSAAMALGVGKWGAGESYFLGTTAAAAVLAGAGAARLLRSARATPALGALLLAQTLLFAHGPLSESVPWLPDRGLQAGRLGRPPSAADRQAGEDLAAVLRRVRGPVLVEDPGVALVAGKPVVANATHLRNLHQAGVWDPTGLVRDVRDRRYDVVVLNAELYPEPVLRAIGDSYYLARVVPINGVRYQLFLPGSR